MEYYAKGIRKFQRELKKPVLDFPQLGLTGELTNEDERDTNNDWAGRNSGDVRKEIENRELQELEEDLLELNVNLTQEKNKKNTSAEYVRNG
jgi:hypothetical protein